MISFQTLVYFEMRRDNYTSRIQKAYYFCKTHYKYKKPLPQHWDKSSRSCGTTQVDEIAFVRSLPMPSHRLHQITGGVPVSYYSASSISLCPHKSIQHNIHYRNPTFLRLSENERLCLLLLLFGLFICTHYMPPFIFCQVKRQKNLFCPSSRQGAQNFTSISNPGLHIVISAGFMPFLIKTRLVREHILLLGWGAYPIRST